MELWAAGSAVNLRPWPVHETLVGAQSKVVTCSAAADQQQWHVTAAGRHLGVVDALASAWAAAALAAVAAVAGGLAAMRRSTAQRQTFSEHSADAVVRAGWTEAAPVAPKRSPRPSQRG